ncbi:4a-hydroxytetrahydrobiopterin dehydratase [Pacificibacter maritimus]|uniref:Putative pterin-4-alpha-carbinolamine dehydratase n=1 Tax=Pacificibacter maritimus TaxID=762213 RepID=A0A3N4U883_9RHOB|nr:4a-hydroxytetrahydrobiopterin dehydratase [Pacificibacter maritimus]RPE63179.1 4a-hydroxytetrahydrobiopterin dehydratase [Pacificibacter maritimus]
MTDLIPHDKLSDMLPTGWVLCDEGTAMEKTFNFADFAEAFSWMTHMALVSEKVNHHPQMLYVYKTVQAYLTTHDANGITEKDITFAQKMNEVAGDV